MNMGKYKKFCPNQKKLLINNNLIDKYKDMNE